MPVAEYLGALQRSGEPPEILSRRIAETSRTSTAFSARAGSRRSTRRRARRDLAIEGLRRRGLAAAASRGACRPCAGSIVICSRGAVIRRDPTEHLDSPRAPRPLPRALSIDSARTLVESARHRAAGRRARPRGARAALRHRHAGLRVLGAAARRSQPRGRLRRSAPARGASSDWSRSGRRRSSGCGGICEQASAPATRGAATRADSS